MAAYVPKKTIAQQISDKLTEAEQRRFSQFIIQMNQENRKLSDQKVDGFLFAGQYYLPANGTVTVHAGYSKGKPPLNPALWTKMERHLRDRIMVRQDKESITQMLHLLLKDAKSNQEVRDTLPECLVALFPELAKLPRKNEPAYTLHNNPRAQRQYEKLLPKMEMYSAAQLLY